MIKKKHISIDLETVKVFNNFSILFEIFLFMLIIMSPLNQIDAQTSDSIKIENVTFKSEGVILDGTVYKPKNFKVAVVIVHGSGQETRMNEFAKLLAKNGICVLTYDKRGVGKSGGVYNGPEIGTNNIDSTNLNLLAKDASNAVNLLHQQNKNIPVGLVGFSQAGWIIPITSSTNPFVEFMVLFSCPTITTLEQLRFQFYTNGNNDFWENNTEENAREHIKNDPDRYQFIGTNPKVSLSAVSIPGLWLFGEKDIQIPVKFCIEQLNTFKVQGKPFEYTLFSTLGHNTSSANITEPADIAIQWIKQKAIKIEKLKH
ncbi:alpha/beta hydrolase family protein [Flavobacterium franklandianum]|nr:alpha/beta hydrolase [Flavobacterium franklandianum]